MPLVLPPIAPPCHENGGENCHQPQGPPTAHGFSTRIANPTESYLYTPPFLFPWLLIALSAYTRMPVGKIAIAVAWVLAAASAATNALLIVFLNTLF